MFGQKFTNTNEMLQLGILHCAKSAPPDLAELNTARVKENFLQHLVNGNAPACLLQSSLIFATRVAIDERDLSKTSILALRQKIGTQAKKRLHTKSVLQWREDLH
jgi:hypothetical protein